MDGFDQVVFLKFLGAYFAVVNPLYGLPIFISLTEGFTAAERRATAIIVTLTVGVTGLVSVLAGEEMLAIFGISVPAFRTAGGIIIFTIGMAMLNAADPSAGDRDAAKEAKKQRRNIAVVPLAIPLTIGPGGIVTSIVFAHQLSDRAELVTLAPAVMLVTLVLGFTLLFAEQIVRLLGSTVLSVMSRIMAIVLTAIAIEMVLTGIFDAVEERYPDLVPTAAASSESG